MKILLRDLDMHLSLGRHLFPLRKDQKNRKRPLHRNFNKNQYSENQLIEYIEKGHGLGWWLGPTDVILDVDPRHGKEIIARSLERLRNDWASLSNTPQVLSGGDDKGLHYYIALEKKVKIKSYIDRYPELNFRQTGTYVVLPGSLHPSGRRYYWDPFCNPKTKPIKIPQWLLKLLVISKNGQQPKARSLSNVSEKEVKHYLDQLDPTNYRSRTDWLQIGFMVHHALGDDGKDLFLSWSQRDKSYSSCDNENERIWESIKGDIDSPLTFASLVQEVIDCGGTFYNNPLEDFKDEIESLNSFKIDLDALPPKPDHHELVQLIKKAKMYGPDEWENLRKQIKDALDVRLSVIDKIYKKLDRKKKRVDYAIIVADQLIETEYHRADWILHANNQQFYRFNGKYWRELKDNIITRQLFETSEDVIDHYKLKKGPLDYIQKSKTAMIARTAIEKDVFGFVDLPPSVVNCQNGELWIDEVTGEVALKPHNPKSYLLNCLEVEYNSKAKCPIFKKTLKGIFKKHKKPSDTIRHIFELFGYAIQPKKDIASWFLFYGRGSNGKSMLIEILQALMGPTSVLPRSIHDLTGKGNNHAMASLLGKLLVIDDDAQTDIPLPASALKKLAEHKLWEANPKGKDQFVFRSSAMPIALINEYPPVRDLSYGMMRRTHVIPFNRIFTPTEADSTLKEQIIENELSGVLNEALVGLKRLRQRGRFEDPFDCQAAREQWLRTANPIVAWISACCAKTEDSMATGALYESYRIWSKMDAGIERPISLAKFLTALEHLGYTNRDDKISNLGVKNDEE